MLRKNDSSGVFALYMSICAAARRIDRSFSDRAQDLPELSGEWLRDNYYLIRRCADGVLEQLRGVKKPLPTEKNGLLRIFRLADQLVAGCPPPDTKRPFPVLLRRYLGSICERVPLSCRELELFPALLQSAVLLRLMQEAQKETAGRLPFLVSLLRFCSLYDFSPLLEQFDPVERIFAQDPGGVYPAMDEQSRAAYRRRVALIADKKHLGESDVARQFLQKAQQDAAHVGFGLFEARGKNYLRGKSAVLAHAACSAVLTAAAALLTASPATALLGLLPVWELLRPLAERAALSGVAPAVLPRIHLTEIPPEGGVMIAVCSLLPSAEKIEETVRHLCLLDAVAPQGTVGICLLADPKESDYPDPPQDQTVITALCRRIREENLLHDHRLFVVVRRRSYLLTQQKYAGKERKRGAVTLLCHLITGREGIDSLAAFEGDAARLKDFRYLTVLDADTSLQLNTVTKLVGCALHPLNRPQTDARSPVSQGYGVFAPRVGVDLDSARRTPFARIFCGVGGVTAYDNRSSDFYQDLFGEAIFCGKGLIDVAAFCTFADRFPCEQILSHDILEGSLLRTAYVSDAEVTDGFPRSAASWLSRLHRWVRGDAQNLIFALPSLTQRFAPQFPTLSRLSRYKLLDNLRRAVTPLCCSACLLSAAYSRGAAAALLWLLGCSWSLLPSLEAAFCALRTAGVSAVTRRFYSGVLPIFQGQLALGLLQTLLMPQTAFTSADALLRALWRTFVSRQHLLEWVTAADGDANRFTLRRFIPQLLFYAAFLTAHGRFSKLLGAGGIAFTLALPLLERPCGPQLPEPVTDHEQLDLYAAASWRFYNATVTADEHFLPPDNLQESPVFAVAHRTSPTNIGMYLVSTVCAYDFALIGLEEMLARIENTVSTLERLERCHGHFYNWYDTQTLQPLRPRYLSTVDSGNLACCFTALKGALREHLQARPQTAALIARIDALERAMDFSVLYDTQKDLFHIGFYAETDTRDDCYYDLLMSEARMTGYYAIARRLVPRKHWERLGRPLAAKRGYRGPLSWSGTMFEYFMPHLFLPVYDGSMGDVALKFCLFCQKHHARLHDFWGISESGFYAFDAQLNYQYRANGVPTLALRDIKDDEPVVSPYSSFLALPYDAAEAMQNLRRLEQHGCFGSCGFFEAIDLAPQRTGGQPAVIRSYMAHHVGMSLVAADNCRNRMIWHKRFMDDAQMRSAVELLMEKIELGAPVYKKRLPLNRQPVLPARRPVSEERFDAVTPVRPRAAVLCSQSYTLALTDTGCSVSRFNGLDVTRRSSDLLRAPQGVFVLLQADGAPVRCVTAAPLYRDTCRRQTVFCAHHAEFSLQADGLTTTVRVSVDRDVACEVRRITLHNDTDRQRSVQLAVYAEPCLAAPDAFEAHPAFSKLFLRSSVESAHRAAVFFRPVRGDQPSAALAAGWDSDLPTQFCLDKQTVLRCPDGIFSLDGVFEADFSSCCATPDGAVCLRTKLTLPPQRSRTVTFLLAAASDPKQALERLQTVRDGHLRSDACGLESAVGRLAGLALPSLLFGAPIDARTLAARRLGSASQQQLWSLGISGDAPLMAVEIGSNETPDRAAHYLALYQSLRLHGLPFDLAVLYRENGDYHSPLKNALTDTCRSLGIEGMIGARNGVHLINCAAAPPDAVNALLANSAWLAPHFALTDRRPRRRWLPSVIHPCSPCEQPDRDDAFVCREPSRRPWCLCLANPTFGTLVSNRALGFSWAVNSHLGKLTPWSNDDTTDNRSELLLLRVNGRIYDLINGSTAVFYPHKAVYYGCADGIRTEVTVQVADGFCAKSIDCHLTADRPSNAELAYYCEPVLADRPRSARLISAGYRKNSLLFCNPYRTEPGGVLCITSVGGSSGFNCDRAAVLCGRWNDRLLTPHGSLCGLLFKTVTVDAAPSVERFVMSWAKNENAAMKLADLFRPQQPFAGTVRLRSPQQRIDLLVNHLLPNQIACCRM
ncbi:MAG: hypothetical protein IJC25_04560, partial [Clostridia bacterium]|nr:hypothetical protein [Clostridia bacterium]